MDYAATYAILNTMGPVKSVDELIDRIEAEHLPIYSMRFFINEDRKEAQCFGIYFNTDTGRWVVYKNKSDGTRAIRLDTTDEAAAAQEIWAKILSEIKLRADRSHMSYTAPIAQMPVVNRKRPESYEETLSRKVRQLMADDTPETFDHVKKRLGSYGMRFKTKPSKQRGAIGICQDNGEWRVFRNDATRAATELYSGPDEHEAVRVLRSWVIARKQCDDQVKKRRKLNSNGIEAKHVALVLVVSLFFVIIFLAVKSGGTSTGHTNSASGTYYYDTDRDQSNNSSSFWDNDDDWDSGWDDDWDSGDTDWDSDW